jgi:hypothetical protein
MAIKVYIQKRPSIVVQVGAKVINVIGGDVDSVNGQTGAVVLDASDVGAYPDTNPSNYVDAYGAAAAAPVQSVNGNTGAVVLTATDVGAPSGSGTSTGSNMGDQDLSGLQEKSIVVSSNTNAVNDGNYTNVATAVYTDPSPIEGKGFRVMVRNGTATVGGTAYSTPGTVILRIFHSGSWANYVYQVAGGGDSPVVLYCDTTPITFTGVGSTETTIREIPIPTNIGNGYIYIRYNIKIQTAVSASASTSKVRIGNVGSNPFTDTLLATNAGTTVSNIDIYRHTPLVGGASGNIKRSTPQGSNIRNDDSAIGQYLDTVNVDWTVAKSIKLSCVLNNAGNVVISDGALVIFYPEKL